MSRRRAASGSRREAASRGGSTREESLPRARPLYRPAMRFEQQTSGPKARNTVGVCRACSISSRAGHGIRAETRGYSRRRPTGRERRGLDPEGRHATGRRQAWRCRVLCLSTIDHYQSY